MQAYNKAKYNKTGVGVTSWNNLPTDVVSAPPLKCLLSQEDWTSTRFSGSKRVVRRQQHSEQPIGHSSLTSKAEEGFKVYSQSIIWSVYFQQNNYKGQSI